MSEIRESDRFGEYVAPDDLTLTDEYQVMDDPDDDTVRSLTVSIKSDGYDESKPITIDGEGNVLDGHNRVLVCRNAGVETVPVVRKTGLSPAEKREVAYTQNMRRRNLDAGAKREVVKRYLKEDFTAEQTQTEVANLLGVSSATVTRARNDIEDEDGVDILSGEKVTTESRREKCARIRKYLDGHPDASDRSAADALDVSKTTVGRVRRAMADDGDDTDGTTESTDTVDDTDTDDGGSTDTTDTETAAVSAGGDTDDDGDDTAGEQSEAASHSGGGGSGGGRSRFRTEADKSGESPDTAQSDPLDGARAARDDTDTETGATTDTDGTDSATPDDEAGPSPSDTKQDVRQVLTNAANPLTAAEVATQVTADERLVRTALSGLFNDGAAENSPPETEVWWLTDTDRTERDAADGEDGERA